MKASQLKRKDNKELILENEEYKRNLEEIKSRMVDIKLSYSCQRCTNIAKELQFRELSRQSTTKSELYRIFDDIPERKPNKHSVIDKHVNELKERGYVTINGGEEGSPDKRTRYVKLNLYKVFEDMIKVSHSAFFDIAKKDPHYGGYFLYSRIRRKTIFPRISYRTGVMYSENWKEKIRESSLEHKYIHFVVKCPKCSTKGHFVTTLGKHFAFNIYNCKKCDYHAKFTYFIEDDHFWKYP